MKTKLEMALFAIFFAFVGALLHSAFSNWSDFNSYGTDTVKTVAQNCSGGKMCSAKLNDDTTLSLQMIGDTHGTWIILGDKRMSTNSFESYRLYFKENPKGLKGISFSKP